MANKKVLFIIHRLYTGNLPKRGGIDHIVAFLSRNNKITLIEHPFDKINHLSTLTACSYSKTHKAVSRPPFLWFEEFLANIMWVRQTKEIFSLAVASDPLNFFSCFLLKKMKLVKATQFHSTDYSHPRFGNFLLEKIYQSLYRFALIHADKTTLVSPKMMRQAEQMVPDRFHRHFFLLPNSPEYNNIPKYPSTEKNCYSLVMTAGIFKDQVDVDTLIDSLTRLKTHCPKAVLHIIGTVEKSTVDLFSENNLENNLVFEGGLPYKQSIDEVAKSYIGITCYKKNSSYMSYADSLKIREYAAAGLPIVCDNVYATAEEVIKNDAGFIYNSPAEMAEAIGRLIENKKLYLAKSQNAIAWAKKMDKIKWLKKLYDHFP